MAEDDETCQPPRTKSTTKMRSASSGSISQLNVNVSDLDGLLNLSSSPPSTTTISTIAVQADESRIVLAVLRSSDIVRVRIQQMEPDLMDIGSHLGDTIHYQTVHEELISKLKGKQDQITELLTRADDLVSQQKSYNEVYEAMARSLGDAWKELNLQLEGRRNLLNQAIRYHTIAARFNERMNDARSWFSSLEHTEFNDQSLEILLNEHDFYRKEILEASLATMNEGQILLERIKELGSMSESNNQHSIVAACYEVEHLLGIHQDQRHQFEDEWEKNRKLFQEYVQMSLIRYEIDQIFEWLQNRGERYLENTELGSTFEDIEQLKRIHTEMENESQTINERVLRCMRAVDSWVHTGLARADRLHAYAHTLLAVWEKWTFRLDSRRRLLRLAHQFYVDSSSAFATLDSIDHHLQSFTSSDDLLREYEQINEQLVQSCEIPLREGHLLLEKTSANDIGTEMVRERVYELERRIEQIRYHLREEYERLDRQGSTLYQTFDHQCSTIESWLKNVLERFLHANRMIIDSTQQHIDLTRQANDFFELHQSLIERDVKTREDDMQRLEMLVRELQSNQDRHGSIARARYENVVQIWDRLVEKLTRRYSLAQSYVEFRHQAEQLHHGLTSIDEVVQYRDNIDLLPESAVKHIEETWTNLRNNYQDFIGQSKRIRHVLETESEQLDLQSSDTHRTIFDQCEQITRKFEQISSSFDGWIRKLVQLRDFKTQWQQFIVDARNTMEKVHRFELNISSNSISIDDDVEKYQRLLSDFANRVQEMTREVEDRLRTAEQLGMRGETNGQKEHIVNELVNIHQQFLTRINHTRSFLHSIINYYKNTTKIETQLVNNTRLLASLPNDIRSTEVLVRQYETEREKIVQTYEQCRQEAQTAENKAQQCGVTTFLNEIRFKQNEIESKYVQWQRQCEENSCKLKQRVEWCQFLDDKYKVVYEMDSLQKEIDKRLRQVPQSFKEAMNRTETFQEIHRLYDSCERSVRRFRTTAQVMLEQKHPEYVEVEQEIKDVERKLSTIQIRVTDYREQMEKVNTYYRLIDEVERWHQDSSQLLIRIGEEIINCHTEQDAKELLSRVSVAIDQGKEYEQEKMRYISTLAVEVFGPEEGHHRIKHVTTKNIELINAFIKVHQDISVVQRNFEHRKDFLRENRISYSQLPNFVKPLKDTNIKEGSKFTFECIIDGSEPITVVWLKDQTVISSLTHDIQYERGLATLILTDVQRNDSAYYTCRASNSAGTVESSAYLIVQALVPATTSIDVEKKYSSHQTHVPPTFIEPLRSLDVTIDATVIFECIIYAEPTPYVIWERDGIEICEGQSLSHSRSNRHLYRLTLRHVQLGDSGQYGCRATNIAGDATSVADLRVFSNLCPEYDYPMTTGYEPRLTEPLKASYLIREGQPVKLSCRFDAVPKADIQWMKDGIPIDFEALGISRDFKVVKEVDYTALLIKEAFPEDTASYTVLIQNPFGEARSFTQLTVEEFFCRTPESEMSDTPCKPVFVQPLLDVTLNEGEKLKLHAAINAHPEPEIIWYCNNTPLKTSRDLTLTFDGQRCLLVKDRCEKENDSGFYRITAVNSMGQAESTCHVTIQGKDSSIFRERPQTVARSAPSILQMLEGRTVHEGEQIVLQVKIIGQPKPQILWYKDNQPLRDTHDHKIRNQDDIYTLEIPELFMDDAGTYSVKAINIEGEAKCSCTLNILPSIATTPMNMEPVQIPSTGFPPEFLQLFIDRQTTLHSTIKFEARLIGTAPLHTYWLFNGTPLSSLPTNPRYQQRISDDTYSLTVQDVSYEDAGRYTLNAENSWGTVTCTAELFVPPAVNTGTETNNNMLSDLLVEMSPSPPLPRKRQMDMSSSQYQQQQQQQQQQHHHQQQSTAMNMARSYEQTYDQHRQSSFISSNNNTSKRYRPLQSSLERTHSLTRDDDYHRRQYPKSIDVFIPYDLLEKERNAHTTSNAQTSTMTRSYEYEIEERRRSSSASAKQQRRTELEEEREYLRCLRDLTNEYEKTKRQKKSSDNRKRTTVDTQEEYETIEEVYRQRPVTTTTTTKEEIIQRSTYRIPTETSTNRINQFEQQFVDNFSLRSQTQPQQTTVVSSYSTRNDGDQRLTSSHRSFSEELLYKRLIPNAKQIYTTNTSAATSEAGFATSDDDLTTMEYRLKRKERLKPIRIYSSTSSIPGETSVKYVRTERQPVELRVPKPQIITTQGEHSTTVVKDVRRSTGKITTNIHQQHQRATIEGEHELRIIKEPISSGQVKAFEFTIPKPIETAPAEHSSTFVVESKKGGRFQTLDVSSALTREHTLAGEHELRVIDEPISSGLHNKAVELLFPKPPLPPPPSQHSSTIVKQTRAPPSSVVVENIQTTLKGEHELRLVDQPIQSGAWDSVELIVPKSVTETAEHTTTIVTETQPHRRVLEITGSGRKMESEHETKFYRDSVRVEEEVEVKLPKQQVERAEHTTTLIKHSRGKAPIIEVDTSRQIIEGEHEMRYVEESVEARANAMELLVAKPQIPAEHSTTIVKEQRGKPQVYAIDRTQVIPGEHETKYYNQPVEALGEMEVLFPKKQPVIGPTESEHMSTIIKQVHSRQIVYDDRLREIPGEHLLTVVDSATNLNQGRDSEVEFIVPKRQARRAEEHSTTVLKRVSQRPVSSSDYDDVFASSAGEEENIRRGYRYEEEESGWTSGGEHTTTYVKHARAKYEPIELVVDKPKIMPSVSTLIADIQGPAEITSIRPTTVIIPEDSSVKLDMELNGQHLQQQFDEMELVFEKPLVRDSSTKLIANIEAGLEVKSFRPTSQIQQQTTVEESSSSLTMQMQQEQEEALELRIRKPHIQESSSVVIANIQPELGIQGTLKATPYVLPPLEESSTTMTMDLNADQPIAPFELIIPRIGVESSTSTVLAQVAPAIAGIRAKVDVPQVERSTSKFVLEQKKRLDEEVELIMPKPKRIETSTSTMIADVEAKLETKEIRAAQVQPETSTSTFYLDQTIENVIPEAVEIRMKPPMIGESSTTVLANVKATLDTQHIQMLGNPYQPVGESSSAIILDRVSSDVQPSEVELILPRPQIRESKSVLLADVRPTLDTSKTHVVIAPPVQAPVKSSSELILHQDDRDVVAPVELHLHRQPSSHTLVAKLDDTRIKHKDMYVLGATNQQDDYLTRDSSSTLYTDLNRPNDYRYQTDQRLTAAMSDEQRREYMSRMTSREKMTTSGTMGFTDNSSTFITEIEPRHLEPVEFIVSGSLTGPNNTLEQYSSGTTSHMKATKQTTSSSNEMRAFKTNNNFDQSFAPYFIASLKDQTVREGESVLFEVMVAAIPLADITWDKDGEIINIDSAFRIDYYSDGRATFYIPETFLDDQGYYTCTARNNLGSCRTTARLVIKATSERLSPTRRQMTNSTVSSSVQHQSATSAPWASTQSTPLYRVSAQTQSGSPSYQDYPTKVVTQVTEETEVIQIPPQQTRTQNNTISYTVEDKNAKFEPVSFQVSTNKDKMKRPATQIGGQSTILTNTNNNEDPNPFKIFGAKLRSRPLTGIVPSFAEDNYQTTSSASNSIRPSQQPAFSSSFPSGGRPDFSASYQ